MSSEPKGHGDRVVRVEISPRLVAWVLGVIAATWLLTKLWQTVMVVVVALMLVGMLNPFVERLALYLMVDRDRMRGAFFALVPRRFHVRVSRIVVNLETIVGGYMRGLLITSVLMSVFTLIVLSFARVPNALVLSLFAGAADVLPYVGAILACGPAFLAALERGTTVALVVLAVLLAYQEFENRFTRVERDASSDGGCRQ